MKMVLLPQVLFNLLQFWLRWSSDHTRHHIHSFFIQNNTIFVTEESAINKPISADQGWKFVIVVVIYVAFLFRACLHHTHLQLLCKCICSVIYQ